MKILIWLGCLIPAAILITAIEKTSSASLGPLPKTLIAGCAAAIAISLCKKIDKKKKENENKGDKK